MFKCLSKKANIIYRVLLLNVLNVSLYSKIKIIYNNACNKLYNMSKEDLILFIQKENLIYKLNKMDGFSFKAFLFLLDNIDFTKKIKIYPLKKLKNMENSKLYVINDKDRIIYIRVKTNKDTLKIYYGYLYSIRRRINA